MNSQVEQRARELLDAETRPLQSYSACEPLYPESVALRAVAAALASQPPVLDEREVIDTTGSEREALFAALHGLVCSPKLGEIPLVMEAVISILRPVSVIEQAAQEAERIGLRWAEDTDHPRVSREVGMAIATAIRNLGGPDDVA